MQGVNTAAEIVNYCQTKPMFREVNNKRYLAATTTRRTYFHVTRAQIETPENVKLFKSRSVCTLDGKYKLRTPCVGLCMDGNLQIYVTFVTSQLNQNEWV